MSEQRFEERKQELKDAVLRLEEAIAQPENDMIRDSVIQRFEFSFELAWKTLQLYLERQGLEAGSPRQALKSAFAQGIISSEDEADVWLKMQEDRNLTTHTYNEDLAKAIYKRIATTYVERFRAISDSIQKLTWK
ncbi:MAG: HI0074 family nucleotidyltransferase substrate-binding subunit [Patescibacteria group bacterium]